MEQRLLKTMEKERYIEPKNKAHYVHADAEKLRRILREKNISMSEASLKCGFNQGYLNCCLNRAGYIRKSCVLVLKTEYGIDLKEYEYVEPEPEPEPEPEHEPEKTTAKTVKISETFGKGDIPQENFNYSELYKLVYTAVYRAVKKAWSE